jgi:murein DD-endopeptidase MepM/ murein hydrolase activator NlpD
MVFGFVWMIRNNLLVKNLVVILVLIMIGCKNIEDEPVTPVVDPTQVLGDDYQLFTQTPKLTGGLESVEAPAIKESTSTPEPPDVDSPTPTSTPTYPYPCTPEICTLPGHFWMGRPIAPNGNDEVDETYRFGSTQEGARSTHHGVEFVNPEGTPVIAAADGWVIVAGNDYEDTYAEYPFYYGNIVIIEHQFPGIETPIFTLYGHLSNVDAVVGTSVQAGDQIGAVGYTGIAEWSHLHFEVRVGDNRFENTYNPELWLQPHQNEDGELNGAVAGRIIDEYGNPIYIPNVVMERIAPGGIVLETIYVETYADSSVNGDNVWGENFAIGDLLPGEYRVSFVARGLQVWDINVYPGQLTLLTFDAKDS